MTPPKGKMAELLPPGELRFTSSTKQLSNVFFHFLIRYISPILHHFISYCFRGVSHGRCN